MSFNIFGPATKNDIRVSYIDPDRGLIKNASIYDANVYASLNPGSVFILETRDRVRYLTINEVNNLTPDDITPDKNASGTCDGIKGLVCGETITYPSGGTLIACGGKSVTLDGRGGLPITCGGTGGTKVTAGGVPLMAGKNEVKCGAKGGSIVTVGGNGGDQVYVGGEPLEIDGQPVLCGADGGIVLKTDSVGGFEAKTGGTNDCVGGIYISGGGGVGAAANPIFGSDGSLLACDLVRGGFGYRFPPKATIYDTCRRGSGAVLKLSIGEVAPTVQYFDQEEDFEVYDLTPPGGELSGYGSRFGPNGENLGEWDPNLFATFAQDPIGIEIQKYQDFLAQGINPFWHTRKEKPLSVTFGDKTSNVIHNVTDAGFRKRREDAGATDDRGWSDWMNQYAVAPVPESNVRGSDYAGRVATMEWEENFPYTGEYVFRGMADNVAKLYLDNELLISTSLFGGLNARNIQPKDTLKKTIKEGVHRIKIDLFNAPAESSQQSSKKIFNTVDYLNKADRKLWRTNVYGRGGFLNEYGVCPFNTTKPLEGNPYSGTHVIRWEHVNFPSDGNYNIEVEVDDNVTLYIGNREGSGAAEIGNGLISVEQGGDEVIIEKNGFVEGTNKGTGKSTYTKFFKKGQYRIRAELYQKPGGNFAFGAEGEASNVSARFVRRGSELYMVVDGSGTATIEFSLKMDDNPRVAGDSLGRVKIGKGSNESVTLSRTRSGNGYKEKETITGSATFEAGKEYLVQVFGASSGVGDPRVKNNSIQFLDTGGSDTNGELFIKKIKNQQKGSVKGINPMALAINIALAESEQNRVSARSFNENPMGAALTIDAPLPPIPQEPTLQSEGRCPNNPIWTTRFPAATEKWWPVTHIYEDGTQSWSKFMNRFAISPIPPLATPNTDGGGIIYSNTWNFEAPYRGFYALKGAVDNGGRILVDGNVILQGGYFTGAKFSGDVTSLSGFRTTSPPLKKFFLEEGSHTITVEVENKDTAKRNKIDKKVFSTQDWIATPPQPVVTETTTETQTEEWVRVDDAFVPPTSGTGRSSGTVTIPDDASFHKYSEGTYYKGKQIRSGGDWNDTDPYTNYIEWDSNTRLTLGSYHPESSQRFGIAVWQKETTTNQTTTTQITNPTVSSTNITKNGITYSGPELFQINSPTTAANWSSFMQKNSISPFVPPIDEDNPAIASASFTFTWSNVNFFENGRYKVLFQADNIGELYIDGQLIKESRSFRGDPQVSYAEISAGNREVKVVCTNGAQSTNVLNGNNPIGFALKIAKEVTVFGDSFSWKTNPVGISAIMIPPPCPKEIKGKGVVVDCEILDPGNSYPQPAGTGYPVTLVLDAIVPDAKGINYSPEDRVLVNGTPLVPVLGPFGTVESVIVPDNLYGFTEYPNITMPSRTGVGFRGRPMFTPVIVPEDVLPDQDILQVTDLVGLKQTGYVNGKPYYGSVFSKDGQLYAGVYETVGKLIPVYATLQESIDGEVTTRPSAILRQGTDVTNNDPRLNLPGTPNNLI